MKYFIKRLLRTIPIVVGVTLITFSLIYLSPSDQAHMHFHQAGSPATEEMLEQFRHEHHLDEPFFIQYQNWWVSFLKGDLGTSYQGGSPVSEKIMKSAPYTISIAINSMILTLLVSIPLGIYCAYHKQSRLSKVIDVITQVGISIPTFIIGLLLLYLFTSVFHIFRVLPKDSTGVIMPSLTIMLGMSFRYIKQIQKIASRELEKDYIKGLRARGVGTVSILFCTVLQSTMVEVITLTAVSFGSLLSGVALIETIFNWPGLGKLLVDAVISKDIPIIQAVVVWLVLAYVLINLLADVLYGIFDARIRLGGDSREA